MNGKGDKRRPESKPGNFNQGYEEINWNNKTLSDKKDTKKKTQNHKYSYGPKT